ncbi:MAG: Asp23/Gls24 family envelope stress response protein [Clostridia bacterium]|nr:Asp23/Gls24 family envelope stress response protein [Clostridia bacterium]
MEENKNPEQEEVEIVETSIDGLKISNDAVATYAGIAISEVQGVYGMSGGFAGITEAISGKKNFSKGIKVEVTEKSAKIDVNIVVEYGARIPDVAFEIQNIVKKSVESMTGLKVSEVNVHVNGVHMANVEDKEESEENIEE